VNHVVSVVVLLNEYHVTPDSQLSEAFDLQAVKKQLLDVKKHL
jgi:hypothetical protein